MSIDSRPAVDERILSELDGSPVAHAHDSSTTALIARASAALE